MFNKTTSELQSNRSGDSVDNRIEIRNIDFSFGSGRAKKQVLFDCNLDLLPGEIVILTGPSGSGKTTLLTLIGALRSIQKGTIVSLGRNLGDMSQSQLNTVRRGIGFIFQGHNLLDALTAMQTVRLATALSVEPQISAKWHSPLNYLRQSLQTIFSKNGNKEICHNLLERLGLSEFRNSLPLELSTGQKQRVAIARALVNHPKIILADEPTASLDQESGSVVMNLLRERASIDGAIILIISHDHRLFPLVDRVIIMEDGSIREAE